MNKQIITKDVKLQLYVRGNLESSILMVFLHGGPGSGAQPLMELEAFQSLENVYTCVYFDQRGCGESLYDVRKGLKEEDICEDVHQVVAYGKREWPKKKVIIWGGSFGGLLTCAYIARYQEIDGIILSSPAITFSRKQALSLLDRTSSSMRQRLKGILPSEEAQVCMEPEQQFQNEHFRSFIFSEMNPSNSLRHIAAMYSWFFQYNATQTIKTISIPTLLMIGEDDPICDCTMMMNEIKTISNNNIRSFSLQHCGHAVFEDQKDIFVKEITRFVKDFYNV